MLPLRFVSACLRTRHLLSARLRDSLQNDLGFWMESNAPEF